MSEDSGPPGVFGVARRLARLSIRRRLNRWGAWQSSRKPQRGRAAVGRKRTGFAFFVGAFGLLMLLQSFFMSAQCMTEHAQEVEWRAERAARLEAARAGDVEHEQPARGRARLPSWPAPERAAPFLRGLACVLTLLFLGIFCIHLSSGNKDLGKPGWDLEWLFTFPVPAKGLFLAKLGEYALGDFLVWLTFFPFLTVFYWRLGLGAWALAPGLVATFGIATIMGASRVVVETALRKRLPHFHLKNLQALFTVLGILILFFTFSLAIDPPSRLFDVAASLPDAVLYLPWTSPLLPMVHPLAGLVVVVWVVLLVALTLHVTSRLVADGLVAQTGAPYAGSRGEGKRAPPGKQGRLRGLLGKEVRLLLRDRNLLVQMLIVPLLVVLLQFVLNPALRDADTSPETAVVIAYGIGAYVLMFGAFSVLYVEKSSLWLLFTLPHRLADLLRRKVALWAAAASIYAFGALAILWRPSGGATLEQWAAPFLAFGGLWSLAYVAAGIGAIGTDPFTQDDRRRVAPQWAYAYFLVAGAFGFALYAQDIWTILVLLVLISALAWAIWQKVDERMPVLLDPVSRPAPRITVASGLVAAFCFFLAQALLAPLSALVFPPSTAVLMAYSLAGLLVGVSAFAAVAGTPNWRRVLGLEGGVPGRRALLVAGGAGLAAGAVALLWLVLVEHVEGLRELRDSTTAFLNPDEGKVALVVLAVLAAPLFEEFLFRGLLFGGLRGTWSARPAILACALLFAVVHPPISFVPVLALGIAAGWVRERTGSLPAAMLTHALYNATAIAAALA